MKNIRMVTGNCLCLFMWLKLMFVSSNPSAIGGGSINSICYSDKGRGFIQFRKIRCLLGGCNTQSLYIVPIKLNRTVHLVSRSD